MDEAAFGRSEDMIDTFFGKPVLLLPEHGIDRVMAGLLVAWKAEVKLPDLSQAVFALA